MGTTYPKHGQSHADYNFEVRAKNLKSCIDSTIQNQIDKKFGTFDKQMGQLYWFYKPSLNIKQVNFLKNPLSDQIKLYFNFGTCEYYLTYMSADLYKDFMTIDEKQHEEYCKTFSFKNPISQSNFKNNNTLFNNDLRLFITRNSCNLPNYNWYWIEKKRLDYDYERLSIISILKRRGFATIANLENHPINLVPEMGTIYVGLYLTPDQLSQFASGKPLENYTKNIDMELQKALNPNLTLSKKT